MAGIWFFSRLSNLNEGGLWLFRIGDIGSEADVEGPGKQPTSSAGSLFYLCSIWKLENLKYENKIIMEVK